MFLDESARFLLPKATFYVAPDIINSQMISNKYHYSLINIYCQELIKSAKNFFVPHCGNVSTGHFGLSGNIQES